MKLLFLELNQVKNELEPHKIINFIFNPISRTTKKGIVNVYPKY